MKHSTWLLLLLLTQAVPAHASDFTLFGGIQNPGRITLGDAGGTGGVLTDPKSFGVIGARLYRSNAPIGFEHTLARSPNFLDSDSSAWIYSTNLLVGVPLLPVRPYATAGLGAVRAGGDGPGAFGSKFAWNVGGGVKWSILGPVGVRIDARRYSVRNVQDQTLNFLETSVGLLLSF